MNLKFHSITKCVVIAEMPEIKVLSFLWFPIYLQKKYCKKKVKDRCHNHGECYCCSRCFPSEARVSLENGKSVSMSELQIGDKVQTGRNNFAYFNIPFTQY